MGIFTRDPFDPVAATTSQRTQAADACVEGALLAINSMTDAAREAFLVDLIGASIPDLSDETLKRCADLVNAETHERIPT